MLFEVHESKKLLFTHLNTSIYSSYHLYLPISSYHLTFLRSRPRSFCNHLGTVLFEVGMVQNLLHIQSLGWVFIETPQNQVSGLKVYLV